MEIVLLLLVVSALAWVLVLAIGRRRSRGPEQTVEGFERALHALDPDVDKPHRHRRRRLHR